MGGSDGTVVFRQQVRMVAVQVGGLRPDELAQALAYEVEPFSGIPASEAEVEYQAVVDADPAVRVYEVAVRRRSIRSGGAGGLERWLRPAVVLAVVVVLAVAVDGGALALRKASLERSVSERRPLQMQLDRLRADEQAARASASSLRSQREAVVRAQDAADALRRAHADVLAALSEACGEDAVLTSIAAGEEPRSLHVRAIGASGESAADVMQRLSVQAGAAGGRLVPGTIAASGTGETVTFGFDVKRKR